METGPLELDLTDAETCLGLLGSVKHTRLEGLIVEHEVEQVLLPAFIEAGWNTVRLKPDDFQNIYGEKLDDWHKVMALEIGDAAALAKDKKRLLPRAGKKGVAAIPTDVSSWGNYTQTTDDYAKDNIEKKTGGNARVRNLHWEGGEYIQRPKHWRDWRWTGSGKGSDRIIGKLNRPTSAKAPPRRSSSSGNRKTQVERICREVRAEGTCEVSGPELPFGMVPFGDGSLLTRRSRQL